jgi:vacuolar-type H+-ATPase subunit E/Vma4
MMDKPDALRLAEVLEADLRSAAHHDAAAAELRRLHAQRDALLEALSNLVDHIDLIPTDPYYREETQELMGAARAAIKAVEENT